MGTKMHAYKGSHSWRCNWETTLWLLTFCGYLVDTNFVLGVQWIYYLGKFSINYQIMEMEFKGEYGRKVVLRGMTNGAPRIVLTKKMENIFRHGVEYFSKMDLQSCYHQFKKKEQWLYAKVSKMKIWHDKGFTFGTCDQYARYAGKSKEDLGHIVLT